MSGYIGNVPVPQATQTRETFTATASQTSFATAGYNPGYIDVFLNGVKLVDGTDYTATNGSDVVLSTGAAASDILEVVAYSTFEVANQAFTGDFSVDSPTFVVDSTNNRVGIGTASPSRRLHTSGDLVRFDNAGASAILLLDTTNNEGFRLVTNVDNTGAFSIEDMGTATSGAGTERMRITSSGDVGIGLTPAAKLDVLASSGTLMRVQIPSVAQLNIGNGGASTNYYDANTQIFRSGGGTERARIDASGNLLVGKTSLNTTVDGVELRGGGQLAVTKDGSWVGNFNRKTSDGDIVSFQKDGTTVGSIASNSGSIEIDSQGSSLKFSHLGTNVAFLTANNLSAYADNAMDLGYSAARFKDLYLSGGVYLGGTGAANYLDDYEEGAWTPVIVATGSQPSVTYYFQSGRYTKIGNLVRLDFAITISSISGGSGAAAISGIPFSTQSGTSQRSVNAVGYNDIFVASGYSPVFEISDGQTAIFMLYSPNATTQRSSTMQISSAVSGGFKYLQGSIIYYTNL